MIKIVQEPLSSKEVEEFLGKPFSQMIKFVADVQREILALGGGLHAEAEAALLKSGSQQENLWGGNLYPGRSKKERIEYTSLINIRPSAQNNSMEINDTKVRLRIEEIVERLLP